MIRWVYIYIVVGGLLFSIETKGAVDKIYSVAAFEQSLAINKKKVEYFRELLDMSVYYENSPHTGVKVLDELINRCTGDKKFAYLLPVLYDQRRIYCQIQDDLRGEQAYTVKCKESIHLIEEVSPYISAYKKSLKKIVGKQSLVGLGCLESLFWFEEWNMEQGSRRRKLTIRKETEVNTAALKKNFIKHYIRGETLYQKRAEKRVQVILIAVSLTGLAILIFFGYILFKYSGIKKEHIFQQERWQGFQREIQLLRKDIVPTLHQYQSIREYCQSWESELRTYERKILEQDMYIDSVLSRSFIVRRRLMIDKFIGSYVLVSKHEEWDYVLGINMPKRDMEHSAIMTQIAFLFYSQVASKRAIEDIYSEIQEKLSEIYALDSHGIGLVLYTLHRATNMFRYIGEGFLLYVVSQKENKDEQFELVEQKNNEALFLLKSRVMTGRQCLLNNEDVLFLCSNKLIGTSSSFRRFLLSISGFSHRNQKESVQEYLDKVIPHENVKGETIVLGQNVAG